MPRTAFEGYVTYNGVSAPFSRLDVETQILYAEDQTSQIGAAYTFHITGFLTGASRAAFQAALLQMRAAWERPRKDFSVTSADKRLWSFTGQEHSANPDGDPTTSTYLALVDDWGPQPGTLRFGKFAAGMACTYSFSITCVAKECLPGGTQCADILSVSQTFVHVVDMNGLTTRVVSGKLLLRASALNADAYRQWVIPAKPLYYRRENQSFSQSDNGRELHFSVTDVEQVNTLPVPITEGQASLQVHIEPSGIIQYTLSGSFGAPANISKAVILQRINDLMIAKIPGLLTPSGQPGYAWVEAFDFTEHIYTNRIDFGIRVKVPVGNDGSSFYSTAQTAFDPFIVTPPGSDGDPATPGLYGGYGPYFTSGIIAPRHVIYDACGEPGYGEQGSVAGTPSTEENDRSIEGISISVASTPGISEAHLIAPFLAYHEVISYEYDNGIIALIPKRTSTDPVLQQTRAPQLKLIQAGYCIRAANSIDQRPTAPAPMLHDSSVVLHASISPATEEVVDANWSKWTVHWKYVMQYKYAIDDSNALPHDAMYWPPNPIRPFTSWADLSTSTDSNVVSVL